MSTKIKNHQISCDSTLCFQRAMESDERSKIKWYFPISKQIKQSEIQRRKSNNWNEQNQKKIFKLPLALRLKSSRQAMRLWIETAELCFQRAMENDERSKIKWYFPISKQIKQTEIQQRKSNNWNEQNQKKINEKRYKQTKIICCRPQGG